MISTELESKTVSHYISILSMVRCYHGGSLIFIETLLCFTLRKGQSNQTDVRFSERR